MFQDANVAHISIPANKTMDASASSSALAAFPIPNFECHAHASNHKDLLQNVLASSTISEWWCYNFTAMRQEDYVCTRSFFGALCM